MIYKFSIYIGTYVLYNNLRGDIMVDYVLKNSLHDHTIVTIMYQRGEEITERDIRVIKLTDKDIEAYCYLRHQVRHFKRENILAAMYSHHKKNHYESICRIN